MNSNSNSNNLYEVIINRRTVRKFDPDYEMPKEDLDKIIKAGLYAPTAKDLQGADFVVVRNMEIIDKIAEIVTENMDDPIIKEKWKQRDVKYKVKNGMTGDANILILIIKNERADEKWVYLDAGIQGENMVLAAESLGISSRYLGVAVINDKIRSEVEKLCNLKENSLMIAIAFGKKHKDYEFPNKIIKSKVINIE